jgi:adenosylcobinamide-GDP ribazoletransferase
MVWSAWLDPLKPGMAAAFGAGVSTLAIALWAVVLAGVSLATYPLLAAALLVVPLIALFWRWRLGGITGDCIGASVEVSETLLLAILVLGA